MFNDFSYTSVKGIEYIINGVNPDLFNDLSHKVLFSIEKRDFNTTFSYNIGISHQLWDMHWHLNPDSEDHYEKVKLVYIEKIKRLLDSQKEEYLDITLTPVNTPSNIDEAIDLLANIN